MSQRIGEDFPREEVSGGALEAGAVPGATDDPDVGPIARAIAGDPDALERVWQSHRRWAAAVLLAHMPRDADLDDLLQDVGMTMVAKISGVRDVGAFKPWLRAVAMSIAKTAGRRRQVRKAGFVKFASLRGLAERSDGQKDDEPGVTSEARVAALSEGRRLLELSGDLPDGYREPLLLKCVQGMSYREVGRVMNLPETTVETRIARARKMLRERAAAASAGTETNGQNQEGRAALAGVRAGPGGRSA